MKVIVIGPIYPFRGGIAHSNNLLCTQLAKSNELIAISFQRMYPEFLYPGKSQKETCTEKEMGFPTKFLIDSVNPLNWIKVAKMIEQEKPDRVLFQWWHIFFTPSYTYIAHRIKKKTNAQIGVICQNVLPHEENKLNQFLTKTFFKKADYFITLSSSDKKIVEKLMPHAKVDYVIESTYEKQMQTKPIHKEEAQKILGANGKVLLFFGFIRPYKGLIYLLKGMPEILKKIDVTLWIVGEWWKDKKEYVNLIHELHIENNVKIIDQYVPNEEVPTYFAATDAVVLPYTSSSESGIIQLAYGLNTPIITTAVGGNVDLIEHKKTGMLVEPQNPEKLSQAILEFYNEKLEPKIKQNMKTKEEMFQWTESKEKIILHQR